MTGVQTCALPIWLAIGAGLCFAKPALSADLSAPKLPKVEEAKPVNPLAGCFGEISGAGQFLAQGDREARPALGVGCTMKAGILIVGGGARYEIGGTSNAGSLWGRVGIPINKELATYALAEWRSPNMALASTGQLYLGAGIETNLFSDNITGFVEGSNAVGTLGRTTRDDVLVRAGIRVLVK